jgi:hypothetical protein
MLPFLSPRKSSSTVMVQSHDDGSQEHLGEEGDEHGILSAAEDLISAIHSKDAHQVAEALKAAVAMLDNDNEDLGE